MKKFQKVVLVGLLISACIVLAENINDQRILEPIISNVEGSYKDYDIKIISKVKASGEALDLPDGPKFKNCPPPTLTSDLLNPNDPTSIFPWTPSGIKQQTTDVPFDIGTPASGSKDGKWGDDFPVYSGSVWGIDWDIDVSTNYLYAVVDKGYSTNDSNFVYLSTDGGESWSLFAVSINTDGSISNPKIRIANDKNDQPWVLILGIWNEPTGAQSLYLRRNHISGSPWYWEELDDSVTYFDADADIGDSAYLYVTYIPVSSTYDVYAARNDLAGNWEYNQYLFIDAQTYPYPQIAAGAGGDVGVAFIDTRVVGNDEVRVKRSANYGQTWYNSQQVSNNTGAYPLTYTDIAYNHTATQTGWIWVTYSTGSPNGLNIGYYYTTNSGVDWTYGGIMPTVGDEYEGNIRDWKTTASGAVTVGYRVSPGDSVNFTWANAASPTGFSTPYRINDNAVTGVVHPMAVAGWSVNYSAIMYVGWGPVDVYWDWFANTGVDEEIYDIADPIKLSPNPSYDMAELSYVVKTEGNVLISLFDVTGRQISNLVNEVKTPGQYICNINSKDLASGIYFLRIITPDGQYTKSMTVVK